MTQLSHNERIAQGFAKIDQDLETLIACVGDVLREIGVPEVAASLPWGPRPPVVGSDFGQPHAQAYSIAFQLLNMVEENTAAHMRRVVETANGIGYEPGLWGRRLAELKAAGWTGEELVRLLPLTRVEPVLTAHPTESKRVTVIQRHRDLYRMLARRGLHEWTPLEREVMEEELRTLIEILWRTGEIVMQKPTVDTERSAQLHYFETVFPESLARIDLRLRAAWKAAGFDPALLDDVSKFPRLRFGTWVGGDRDGHPLVTAEVTRRTLSALRAGALRLHRGSLDRLRASLSLSELLQSVPGSLRKLLASLSEALPEGEGARLVARNPHEPWRQAVSMILARLPSSEAAVHNAYVRPADLIADLRLLRSSLCDSGALRLARERIDPILRNLDVFGFHLSKLDIRQNSQVHERAIEQILKASGLDDWSYASWSEEKKRRFLSGNLSSPYLLDTPAFAPDSDAGRVLECYRAIAEHIDTHGTGGLGFLIVSMTRDVSDLLAVYFLARHGGMTELRNGVLACRLPVMPLFETFDDLMRGPAMVTDYLDHPVTKATLDLAGEPVRDESTPSGYEPRSMTVMIGYSDSNKDCGMLAGSWALFKAQSEISTAAARHGVRIRFFHGRGGTISRGAGPTHRFLEALPTGSLGFDFRLTEQGETIAQKYANLETSVYQLESLLAGVTGVSAQQMHGGSPKELADTSAIERLVEYSRAAYRELWDCEGFGSFHRQATPIDALESSRIGSRPARRTGAATLSDLRAIPWVFSWSQSRFFLTGWYGVGSALARLKAEHPEEFERVSHIAKTSAFMRYALGNIETSVSSAEPEVMREYARLVEDAALRERFLGMIEREYTLTLQMATELLGEERGFRRPRLQYSLRRRNEALRPLHSYQVRLLRSWRAAKNAGDNTAADALIPGLLVSINAIASGLRTTG